MFLFIMQATAAVPLNLSAVNCSFSFCDYHYDMTREFVCCVTESDLCMETATVWICVV